MWLYVKLAGILCILAASVLTGLELESRVKKRWLFLRGFTETLRFLEKETAYHRTPLGEALREAAAHSQDEVRKLLLCAAELIPLRTGTTFGEIWEEALADADLSSLLAQPELLAVQELSAALCNPDTVMQKTLLDKYTDRLAAMTREAECQYKEKGNLYRKLSAAAGIFLSLILI